MKCHLAKLALLIRKRHIAFDCRNYTAMDESILSTADEIEPSAIEEIAGVPNADKNMAVCSCRGMCLREKGRNACPCRETGLFCYSVCHPDSTSCWNWRNQSDTDNSSETSEGETQVCTF
jgi:hypothetical protein